MLTIYTEVSCKSITWPQGSPDCNQLDNILWPQNKVQNCQHQNVDYMYQVSCKCMINDLYWPLDDGPGWYRNTPKASTDPMIDDGQLSTLYNDQTVGEGFWASKSIMTCAHTITLSNSGQIDNLTNTITIVQPAYMLVWANKTKGQTHREIK